MPKEVKTDRSVETARDGSWRSAALEWRANWPTGLASFLGMGMGGSIIASVFSLFVLPLQESFGWSRGQIGAANMASFAAAVSAPFLGRFIDRKGTRGPLLVSFVLLGIFWALLASMQGSLILFYVLFTALTVAGLPSTGLGYSRVLSATFVKSRGFSLAVGRGGMSVATTILPIALFAIMEVHGWRAGYLAMAALALFAGLPIAWLGIERRRQNTSDCDLDQPKEETVNQPETLSTRALLADRRVIVITFASAMGYAPLVAIMSQSQPLLVEQGLSQATAAMLVGLFGVTSIIGALITGLLLDRFWAPAVAMGVLALGATGALILATGIGTLPAAAFGILLVGFTLGAEIDICAFIVARYCGLANYSSVYGITIFGIALVSAIGSVAMGYMYDMVGSYGPALAVCAAAFLLSGLSYLSLGRYPQVSSR